MNTFDKLNLEIDINAFQFIDYDKFSKTISCEGELTSYCFQQTIPYWLKVVIKPSTGKVFIEFTGKILCEFYPELISEDTILECISNLNNEELFCIEPEDLIDFALVKSCDVTCDIKTGTTVEDLYNSLILKNNRKYCIKSLNQAKTSFTIFNTVADTRSKEALLIYDKENEIKASSNQPFLDWTNFKQEIIDAYENKTRLELNLHSVNRIRKYFNIPVKEKPSLYYLLTYQEDIIHNYLQSIIETSISIDLLKNAIVDQKNKINVLLKVIFLCLCGFNLPLVEKTLRELNDNTTGISRIMEPYKRLVCEINHIVTTDISDVKEFYDMQIRLEELIYESLSATENNRGKNLLLECYENYKKEEIT